METKTGFLEEAPGVSSSSRIGVMAILAFGIISTSVILFFALLSYQRGTETLQNLCLSTAAFFGSHITGAITWKSIAKSQEVNPQSKIQNPQ